MLIQTPVAIVLCSAISLREMMRVEGSAMAEGLAEEGGGGGGGRVSRVVVVVEEEVMREGGGAHNRGVELQGSARFSFLLAPAYLLLTRFLRQ